MIFPAQHIPQILNGSLRCTFQWAKKDERGRAGRKFIERYSYETHWTSQEIWGKKGVIFKVGERYLIQTKTQKNLGKICLEAIHYSPLHEFNTSYGSKVALSILKDCLNIPASVEMREGLMYSEAGIPYRPEDFFWTFWFSVISVIHDT